MHLHRNHSCSAILVLASAIIVAAAACSASESSSDRGSGSTSTGGSTGDGGADSDSGGAGTSSGTAGTSNGTAGTGNGAAGTSNGAAGTSNGAGGGTSLGVCETEAQRVDRHVLTVFDWDTQEAAVASGLSSSFWAQTADPASFSTVEPGYCSTKALEYDFGGLINWATNFSIYLPQGNCIDYSAFTGLTFSARSDGGAQIAVQVRTSANVWFTAAQQPTIGTAWANVEIPWASFTDLTTNTIDAVRFNAVSGASIVIDDIGAYGATDASGTAMSTSCGG
jgi:hypothetical protein